MSKMLTFRWPDSFGCWSGGWDGYGVNEREAEDSEEEWLREKHGCGSGKNPKIRGKDLRFLGGCGYLERGWVGV